MKQKLYEKVTEYILNNNPCTSETIIALNLTSSNLSATLCGIRNKDQALYQKLYDILEKNNYRNVKGYKMALEIIKNELNMDQAEKYLKYKPEKIKKALSTLEKYNLVLANQAYSFLNKNVTVIPKSKPEIKPKKIKLAEYIIINKCTVEQAMEYFNLKKPTFWAAVYNIKKIDAEAYKKVKDIIGCYSNKNPKHMITGITKYEQICFYILQNKVSVAEAAEHFNISAIIVSQAVFKLCRTYKPKLFTAIKMILDNLPSKRTKMIIDMIKNELSIDETAEKFKVCRNTILEGIKELKKSHPDLYSKAEKLKNKDKKYIKLANYILDNDATIEQTAQEFKMTNQIVRIYIHNMKKQAPELYEKLSCKL